MTMAGMWKGYITFAVLLTISLAGGVFLTFISWNYSVPIILGSKEGGYYEVRSAHGFPLQWNTIGFEINWISVPNLLIDLLFWSLIALSVTTTVTQLGKRYMKGRITKVYKRP